jgi:hypothetical protein
VVLGPVAVGGLLWALVHLRRSSLGWGRLSARGTAVVTYALLAGLVLAISELASIDRHFTATVVGATWWTIAAALAAVLVVVLRADHRRIELRHWWTATRSWAGRLRPGGWVAGATLGAFTAALAATGIRYRPSNGDSLVYHLPRVEHWLQNRTIAHFPTHYLALVELAPLHELSMAHLHLLAGTDRLDGFVQLSAYVVCIAAASELARLLGGGTRAQVLSAVVAATIPAALLEGTSTQNNLFGAAIGAALLVGVLGWDPAGRWAPQAAFLGLSTGLAYLAKGTVLALIGPAALLLGAFALADERRHAGRVPVARIAASVTSAALMAAVAALPFVLRNVELFDGPTGPVSESTITQDPTPAERAANVVRSIGANYWIGDDDSGFEAYVRDAMFAVGRRAFDALDVDAADPRLTLGGGDGDAFAVRDYRRMQRIEEFGANPWHLTAAVVAGGVLIVGAIRDAGRRRVAAMAIGLAGGYIAFTASARWSPFASRYLVAWFVAASPLIGLVLARWHRAVATVVASALVVAALPPLLRNVARPLVDPLRFESPLHAYFRPSDEPQWPEPAAYDAVARAVTATSCRDVGMGNWILFEYPLWVALDFHDYEGELRAVGVINESAVLAGDRPPPCLVVQEERPGQTVVDDGLTQFRFDDLVLSVTEEHVADVQRSITQQAPGS